MASTSAPQQGNLPTEVMPQMGMDSQQVAQLLRELPQLLNKVRVNILPPIPLGFLVAGDAPGWCDLRVRACGSNRRRWNWRSDHLHLVITFATYIRCDLFRRDTPAAFLFGL